MTGRRGLGPAGKLSLAAAYAGRRSLLGVRSVPWTTGRTGRKTGAARVFARRARGAGRRAPAARVAPARLAGGAPPARGALIVAGSVAVAPLARIEGGRGSKQEEKIKKDKGKRKGT